MKKFLFLAATALFALTASAQTNGVMRVNLTDGSAVEHPVGQVNSADFNKATSAQSKEAMRVKLTDGTTVEYPVSDISSVNFRSAEPTPPTVTDLGGEANSYVVSAAGSYKFRATHVDGSAIKNIASATWLWREKADQPLISDVSYADGTVSFTAAPPKATPSSPPSTARAPSYGYGTSGLPTSPVSWSIPTAAPSWTATSVP